MEKVKVVDIGNPFKDLSPENKRKLKRVIIAAVIIIVLIIIGTSSWYTVEEKQHAVITTFGKVTGITEEAGIHFKLPFGIQKVHKVGVNVFQKIEIGFVTKEDGTAVTVSNESKMITGDFNIVNVDFFVEYQISNPEKYLFASENPVGILKSLVQSQIRTVVSSYKVDDVLTVRKAEIQSVVKELIISELETYDIGLKLLDVKIQDAEAPTEEVAQAFKAVETAKQGKETAMNEARAYENSEIPAAEAEADKLVQNAEYLKQKRINEAKQQIAMFDAVYKEYVQNPVITKRRMYFEAIESILPGVKVYINTGADGTTELLLPLESFTK